MGNSAEDGLGEVAVDAEEQWDLCRRTMWAERHATPSTNSTSKAPYLLLLWLKSLLSNIYSYGSNSLLFRKGVVLCRLPLTGRQQDS